MDKIELEYKLDLLRKEYKNAKSPVDKKILSIRAKLLKLGCRKIAS